MVVNRASIIFILIAVIGLIFSGVSHFSNFRVSSRKVLLPVASILSRTSLQTIGFFEVWNELKNLNQENADLKQENISLKAQVSQLNEVKNENDELRRQLGVNNSIISLNPLVARVITRSPFEAFQTITVDKGIQDGIEPGQVVLSAGFLVGQVSEVSKSFSTVKLITAHNSLIPVVLSQSRAKGLLRGGIKGLVVEDIPADATVSGGEQVVTANLANTTGGVPVGQIDEIISTKGEIFQVVKVNSPVNINQLSIVVIAK